MTTTTIAKPKPKPTFLQSKIGGLPRAFWALWTGTLVNRVGMMVEPFIGVYLTQSRGMSLAAAGAVMAVFGAGSLISQILAGWLADRFGRRITLTGGMVATAVTMVALGASTSLPAIVTAMFVLGLTIDAYRPASNALVADLVSPEDRPRAYGLLFWALNLGFAVAMVIGGRLAEAGYAWMFWFNAVTAVVFGLLVWRAVPETRPEPGERAGGGFGAVLRDRLMVAYIVICVLSSLVYAQAFTTLPLAMTGAGLGESSYGLVMAVNGVLIVLVQPLTGDWFGKRDHSTVLAIGYAVIGGGFALNVLVSGVAGYASTVVVWTLGEIVTAGIPGAIVASLAPPHLRGRYSGMFGFAWSAGTMLAPLLGTRLLAAGPAALWLTVGAVNLVAAAGLLAIGPALRRRTAATSC
ncbi:MDR family MFS transporter [Planomonospora venezuelensis]|uniref:MFS family permease n=1 Tax=Planomonospora venezuelensis TaxID=1999 RepID=A0A841CV07_PLAVE|nr:MFS transporter [Planomonospora venezuelensis]MBB5961701.1 MFS family permease [Planomonospora venezuelensis]GIM98847.1 MFS transporter [Planomonospora venezuelensis]